MAFFGIEVKPENPFTHSPNNVKGRLRISQATLGIGSATDKSLIQCNIGDKSPVPLCVLIPDKRESCQLDLEFDEVEDVVFSVIGPRSIYLSGYFVGYSNNIIKSDTEPSGEDIGFSESEEPNDCSDEEHYEDSFIDDDELKRVPSSPVVSNEAEADDTEMVEDKLNDGKGSSKQHKKRNQVVESDDETMVEESEDGYLLNVSKRKRASKNVSSGTTGGFESKEVTEAVNSERRRKAYHGRNSLLATDGMFSEKQDDSADTPVNGVSSDIPVTDDVKDSKDAPVNVAENGNCGERETMKDYSDDLDQKEKKDYSEDAKILETENVDQKVEPEHTEVGSGEVHHDLIINHNKQDVVEKMETDAYPAKLDSESGSKSKKRKEREGGRTEGSEASQGDLVKGGTVKDDVHKVVTVKVEVDEIPNSNRDIEIKKDVVLGLSVSKKKTKTKKKKKNKSTVTTTLPSGLVIEELLEGEPNGKVAAPGKKVKVYYTCKTSKEDDLVFGKNPFKFRLGDEEIMEGWNLGIDGMRVGGARKLTIPPSLCKGKPGAGGDDLPPNSSLVFVVNLVRVC